MSATNADGDWYDTRPEWASLLEQWKRVMAQSAQLGGEAWRSRSVAVEQRLCSEHARAERATAEPRGIA
jgi:hypothetical protein